MSSINKFYKCSKHLTVLMVEDDEILNQEMYELLNDLFYKVDAVYNAKEALSLFSVNHYDLIVTDINLPGMNGLDMAQEMRNINLSQKIVVMSAYKEMEYYEQMFLLNIDEFIPKPFVLENFVEKLEKIIYEISLRKDVIVLDDYE